MKKILILALCFLILTVATQKSNLRSLTSQAQTKSTTIPKPVATKKPVPNFTHKVTQGGIEFDAVTSQDPDKTITQYIWNFGDKTPIFTSKDSTKATHKYKASGLYFVTLTVMDNKNAKFSIIKTFLIKFSAKTPIVVSTPDPAITPGTETSAPPVVPAPSPAANQPPIAKFTFIKNYLYVDFDASSSTDNPGSIQSYNWDFGDAGSSETCNSVRCGHFFSSPGTYKVVLTITDNSGAQTTEEQELQIDSIDGCFVRLNFREGESENIYIKPDKVYFIDLLYPKFQNDNYLGFDYFGSSCLEFSYYNEYTSYYRGLCRNKKSTVPVPNQIYIYQILVLNAYTYNHYQCENCPECD